MWCIESDFVLAVICGLLLAWAVIKVLNRPESGYHPEHKSVFPLDDLDDLETPSIISQHRPRRTPPPPPPRQVPPRPEPHTISPYTRRKEGTGR